MKQEWMLVVLVVTFVLVEIGSVTSEIRRRKKGKRQKAEKRNHSGII